MGRRTLLFVLLAITAAGISISALKLVGRMSLRTLAVESLSDEALPELLQRLRDFHRVVTRNGEKVLEISAKEASFFRDSSAVQIVAPRVAFFDKGEQVGEISGGAGSMVVDNGNLLSVEVTDGVKLSFVQFEITTDDVFYNREAGVVVIRGPATLKSDQFAVTGTGMTLDLGEQMLKIPESVRMRVFRAEKPHGKAASKEAS
jgi:LPS export ABC transporter protein LptC